jgi:hypothetical protein
MAIIWINTTTLILTNIQNMEITTTLILTNNQITEITTTLPIPTISQMTDLTLTITEVTDISAH